MFKDVSPIPRGSKHLDYCFIAFHKTLREDPMSLALETKKEFQDQTCGLKSTHKHYDNDNIVFLDVILNLKSVSTC